MSAPQDPGATLSVACLSVSAALGGSEWSLLDFARRARANGVHAVVVLPKDGPLVGQLREAGVTVGIAPAPESFLSLSQREMLSVAGLMTLSTGVAKWSRAIYSETHRLLGRSPGILYSNGFKAHLASALVRGPRRVWHLREFPPDKTGANQSPPRTAQGPDQPSFGSPPPRDSAVTPAPSPQEPQKEQPRPN